MHRVRRRILFKGEVVVVMFRINLAHYPVVMSWYRLSDAQDAAFQRIWCCRWWFVNMLIGTLLSSHFFTGFGALVLYRIFPFCNCVPVCVNRCAVSVDSRFLEHRVVPVLEVFDSRAIKISLQPSSPAATRRQSENRNPQEEPQSSGKVKLDDTKAAWQVRGMTALRTWPEVTQGWGCCEFEHSW